MITIRSIQPSFLIKTVVFSLLLIGITGQIVDWLFFYESKNDLTQAYRKQYKPLILLIEQLESQELENALSIISTKLQTNIDILSQSDLHINQNKQWAEDSEPFFTSNDQNEVFLYKTLQHGLLRIGPLTQQETKYTTVDLIISIGFYCFILVVIVFFLMPVVIDLDKLSKAAEHYRLNKGFENLKINTKSPIFPLAQTFQTLVRTIADMLRYQTAMHRTISHELRTPLSRIKFSMALLNKEALSVPDQQYLETIHFNIDALEKLIDQMLQYSKIENTKELLRTKTINPDIVLKQIKEEFDSIAYDIKVEFDLCATSSHININADSNLLFIAISNILQNAIMHAISTVKIESAFDDRMFYIFIDDDGPGVSTKALESLYLPFAGSKEHSDGSKSYGLGLAITKHILDLHNAGIKNKKSAMGGARFVIAVPLV